ncbi:hypothetical protein FORMA_11230 [Formosa sp. Hel3_A1_48]|jgi:hypothetical protein|nr:hypothetical protein FORMA_11230 [Formosa sp. Hel3_A1_48]
MPKTIKANNKNFFKIKMFIFSNIRNISQSYLRGLEIAELKEEDMPMVS